MQAIIDSVNSVVWSPAMIYLSLGAGLLFSFRTRFVQLRLFKTMCRLVFSSRSSGRGISSFQALSLSLSGRVGTGNIAGVAAAIGFGGPGAIFWMWVVAFLGASTAFIESTLGQIYKEELNGQLRGGPAFYLEKATGQKWAGVIFAVATIVAVGVLLPGVQANAISSAAEVALGPGVKFQTFMGEITATSGTVGLIVVAALAAIIFGGIKRIAHVTQVVVPIMAFLYLLVALVIIAINISALPRMIMLIIGDAFSPMAGLGAALGWGIRRGVFSSEAGIGTAAHASSAAEVRHPAQQGLVQSLSVYIDTLIVCSATAFMILLTNSYNVVSEVGGNVVQNLPLDIDPNGPAYTQQALESILPGSGPPFVAIALLFFAFTTILAYYYIAETNISYLRRFIKISGAMPTLKITLMFSAFYGAVKTSSIAWGLGDLGIGLMTWLNLIGMIAIFFISNPALKALNDYESQLKLKTKETSFDPEKLGIENADFWSNQG